MNAIYSHGKREQNKQANRAMLLDAAKRCFLEMGYDAATVRDIVRLTDLASGTFYNYFPDKETMFREILENRVNNLDAKLQQLHREAPTLEAFIRDAFLAFFRMITAEPQIFGLVLRNEHAVRGLFKDTVISPLMRTLKQDIRDAVQRGVFPDVDVDLLAATFYGTAFEIGRVLVEQPGTSSAEAAADFAARLLTNGLGASSRPPAPAPRPDKARHLGLP
ncbi:MAG: TetR/AcrR family transcriptional regulator [Nevskia sp.]|nr:TetR/AcrR family transcriptional regulator [Nevskia sp.]